MTATNLQTPIVRLGGMASTRPGNLGGHPIIEGQPDDMRQLEWAAALLDAHPDYRVTRALPQLSMLSLPEADGRTRTALVIDVETTSLDPTTGSIIEFAACQVQFDRQAQLVGIGETVSWVEDPGHPLNAEITALTGLTDADLAGCHIDDNAVLALLGSADLCIAHNAVFDSAWVERRYPKAAGKPWCCSMREIDWRRHGAASRTLGVLLDQHAGFFNPRHRAAADVDALVALLATTLPAGGMAMTELILTAYRPTFEVAATNAPFAAKDALKERGYRWNAPHRVWRIEVAEAELDEELVWLADHAGCTRPATKKITWFTRHRA